MSPVLRLSELALEVTNACHHRCTHCSTEGGIPRPDELTQEERLRVLRGACDLGLIELRLLGGDPLFRLGDTLGLVAEANQLGVQKALVYTSAVERDLAWLKAFAALQPISLSAEASIYSASASVHDGITLMPGSLDRLLTNSREAARLGFDLNWNYVWMKPNFHDLQTVVALASDFGIKRVRILRLMLNGRARANRAILEPSEEMTETCGQMIEAVSQRFPGVQLAHSKPLTFHLDVGKHDSTTCCSAGGAQLVVQADGIVLPCIGMKDTPALQIGDVRRQSLRQVLSKSHGMKFGTISQQFHQCPAILYQQQPDLIQISL